jgi:hypothetical protein
VKHRGPFRKAYDEAKFRYSTTRPGWTKGHIDLAARRKAAKLFLSMLWVVWREAEALPVRGPWVAEYGGPGHTIEDPWEYVKTWPEKPVKEPEGAEE